jgi:hypothetical protein
MKGSFATGDKSCPEDLEPHTTVFHDANNWKRTRGNVVLV